MPPAELKEWVSLIKDVLLGLGALVAMTVAVYGVRMWKRELAGKEIFSAAKTLVKESHLLAKAARQAREPVSDHERRSFTDSEIENTTRNERWRISEVEELKKRLDKLSPALDTYRSALLDARVLIGSRVYGAFLPFDKSITEVVNRIGNYTSALQDYTITVFPDSPVILELQAELYPSQNLDDDLTQRIGDCREEGEVALLGFLHRTEIST